MKKGSFIQPSKRLQFGNVVSGGTTQRRRAQEGDKTYTKAVQVPSGARTDKSSRIVYDADGNRIGRRVAGSRPMYVPDKKNAGSLSKQGAENINRSRGRTKKEIAQGTPSNRDMPRGAQPAPRRQAQPDGPAAPSRPAPRRRPAPAPARRPSPRVEKLQGKSAGPIDSKAPKQSLKVAKPAPKPAASSAPASSGNKRVDKIRARAEKRVGKIQDRRAKAGKKAAAKEARKAGRAMVREAKGKPAKRQMGGLGAASVVGGLAGQAMQRSENPTMQKIGKGLSAVSGVAGAVAPGAKPAPAKYGKIKAKKGTLKEPTNSGLKKLPKNVRNKMGFKKSGGMKDRRKGGYGKKK